MNQENFEKLTERLYYAGFGDKLNAELKENLAAGKQEFAIRDAATIDKDNVDYGLNYRKDDNKDWTYWNTLDVNLTGPGIEEQGRQHTFFADKNITAMEAHRLLKYGDLVGVNKTLFNANNEKYNTWISVDVHGVKDQYGNFPLNTYHENYFKKHDFDIRTALKEKLSVPVVELENSRKIDDIEKDFKKGKLPEVTIMHNGEQATGYLSLNLRDRKIDVYDQDMTLIERQGQAQQQAPAEQIKEATPEQQPDDVKKKPMNEQQRPPWNQPKKQNRGLSH
ncbi:hypothetical protein [Pedobacter borealis]|uniref:hypothetical protein n=1 Tax=Pedobacter borealis TaxID=475254 RepID=UPI000493B0C8|nr:hypothetical protein [Pedobacter borealis]